MLRGAAGRAMAAGRFASAVFGLALILALLFGVASMALGADGDFFKVGRTNLASAVSTLDKSGAGPALRLLVDSGAPLSVDSTTKVTSLNADRIDNLDSAAFQWATLPAVETQSTNPQAIPHATLPTHLTTLQFPSENFDQVGAGQSGEMHSTTTNNSRLTAPKAGIYQINVQVDWAANTTGVRFVSITKNGGANCLGSSVAKFDRVNATTSGVAYNHISTLLALNQGDYIEVCVQQTSGAALNTSTNTFADMHYVSAR